MAEALQFQVLPSRLAVKACFSTEDICVEFVETSVVTGEVGKMHGDNVLCRIFSDEHVDASVTYDHQFAQPLGKLMFVPSGIANCVDARDSHISAVLCRISNDWLNRLTALPRDWNGDYLKQCANIRSSQTDQGMLWLARELCNPGFASNITIESLVSLITVELGRHFNHAARVRPELAISFRGQLSPRLLDNLREFIRSSTPCPKIDAIAAFCGCSPAHIRRLFKRSTGKTLHQFVLEVRADRAKELLTLTNLSIAQIARELGFAHVSGFATAFKQAVGKTALEYRFRN